ncbi:MAG: nicotinate (nicotinamide) nucleotide adenylyltransferase [Acidobacteriia bacterium]|nr:nicotinate (nicotinamide) nucleotide adenylyltransferase [Terriglobia bacterium]
MNVALFGGTFDPVHRGHLAVARAAQAACQLGRVYFVPADIQPLKQRQPVTPFYHRYAMLALATRGEQTFIPSLLEAPGNDVRRAPSFTIDTVRRFRATLPKSDRLFFLLGIDSFLAIAKWREPEALLREVEFIVASRPGFSLTDIARALPASLRPRDAVSKAVQHQPATGDLALGGVTLHILADLEEKVSATEIRSWASSGRGVSSFLDEAVAAYIAKMHLYKSSAPHAHRSAPARRRVASIRDSK